MILEGKIVTSEAVQLGQIEFDEAQGIITSVGRQLGVPDIRSEGLIFPGFVDIHVHAREYPLPPVPDAAMLEARRRQLLKEDFESVGRAAVNGGVTCIAEMPNNPWPPATLEIYQAKRALAERCAVPVLLYGAVTKSNEPFAEIPYKLYMDCPSSEINFGSAAELEEALPRFRGSVVAFHCEDPGVLCRHAHRPGTAGRPPEAEVLAVERVLEYTARFNLRAHVCHLSTRAGFELIQSYNRGKLGDDRVTFEVTPHHLAFSESHAPLLGPGAALESYPQWRSITMKPPLRAEDDRRFLLEMLRQGEVDCLATDHAPHTLADKASGAFGVPLLDHFGRFVSRLLTVERVPAEIIAKCCAENPGAFVSRFMNRKRGLIRPGYAASFTILDPDGRQSEINFTKCGWSPFPAGSLPGRVRQTVVDGKIHDV